MSFGLGHGRTLDDAPGVVGVTPEELPSLPDDAGLRPESGRVDVSRWFPEPAHPLEIEIGSGKGSFLLDHAGACPGINLLGIEWAREFYLYSADRVRRRGLRNVRMLRADGADFLRWRLAGSVVSVLHLYYSDPWPKAKHHKNRVVQDRFLQESLRVLRPGGELRLVTDHPGLWEWYEDHLARWCVPGRFERREFVPPDWTDDDEVVGTNYERKTRAAGREPRSAVLVKPEGVP
ncbi:MAG: hypothetical protein WAZ94_00105 [Phycisphaerales bacterium]